MGCLRRLIRLLILAAILIVALIVFLPKFLAQAGNGILSNVDSSANPISGLAQFIPANFLDKSNKLQISLSGLDTNRNYEVTLDPGACGDSGSIDVGPVTSDGSGNVNATFSLASLDTSQNWFVDVHSGTSASDSVLACTQLNSNNTSAVADANNTALQLGNTDLSSSQTSSSASTTSNTPPGGFPNTGVAPGSNNSYDNNSYPRKY
jgi:hypothetical protein